MSAALLGGLAAQSTLGAALGLGGLWLLRHRSPLDRAVWLKVALGLLLALPLLPRVSLPMPAAVARLMAPSPTQPAMRPALPAQVSMVRPAAPSSAQSPSLSFSSLPLSSLALIAYGAGVAGLLGHLLLGLGMLRRWTRLGQPLRHADWQRALTASGAPTGTRLLVSARVKAPLSWGLRHPVILIDMASAGRPADAPAILAHEAAHIARADWLALMGARVATALFWFNPLVWVMARALVQHCEEAADARALIRCAPADYAETLMTCLAGCGAPRGGAYGLPANGMAAGHGLSRRVHQVLDAAPGALLRRSRGALAGVTGVAVLAVAASLVNFAYAADPAGQARTTRIIHPDGTVETRQHAANGDTTIEVMGANGHRTSIRVNEAHGHRVTVTSYGPGDSVPAAPPVPPVPPMPAVMAVPPAPPAPPPADADDEEQGMMSSARIARIRADALRQANEAMGAQSLVQAAAARAQAEIARINVVALANRARREALAQAGEARVQALAEARAARSEALAEARAARHLAGINDDD